MTNKRPKDLPAVSAPTAGDKLILDGGTCRAITYENLFASVLNNAPTLVDPHVGTQAAFDGTTKAASTAYVDGAVVASTSGVASVNGQTGSVVLRSYLTANRTYYVRTDGSDSNTGLANTALGAFLTLQKAANVAFNGLDLNGFNVTIQIADGTYTGGVAVTGAQVGAGLITFLGNASTPANVIVSTTSADAFSATQRARFKVDALKVATATSGNGLIATYGAEILHDRMNFGACASIQIEASDHARVIAQGSNYTISGGAVAHYHFTNNGYILHQTGTVTLTGTPAFSAYFAGGSLNASLQIASVTYSGAATGQRFLIHSGAACDTGNAGLSYFPGNSAGTVYDNGQYDGYSSIIAPTTYTPTVTAGTGTFTSVSGTGDYKVVDQVCHIAGSVTITTNGTAATNIIVPLPAGVLPAKAAFLTGRVTSGSGLRIGGSLGAGAPNIVITKMSDDTYPGATGYVLEFSGSFLVS